MASYKTVDVKETENGFQTKETVNGGYLNRGECAYYTYTISWDKDYKIVKFMFDTDDLTELALNGLGDSDKYMYRKYEYGKMKVAIPRHLKALKIFTGAMAKPEEKKPIKLIYKEGYYFSLLKIGNVTSVSDKRLTTGSSYTSDFNAVDWTPELEKIALEYNEKLKEFESYKKEVLLKLFNNKKYNKLQ